MHTRRDQYSKFLTISCKFLQPLCSYFDSQHEVLLSVHVFSCLALFNLQKAKNSTFFISLCIVSQRIVLQCPLESTSICYIYICPTLMIELWPYRHSPRRNWMIMNSQRACKSCLLSCKDQMIRLHQCWNQMESCSIKGKKILKSCWSSVFLYGSFFPTQSVNERLAI